MSSRTLNITRMVFATFALAALASTLYLPLPARAGNDRAAGPLASAFSDRARTTAAGRQASDSRVEFEENQGQFDSHVRYVGRAGGSTVFLTATEAVYVLPMPQRNTANSEGQELFALRMKLVGANPDSTFAGEARREHRTNYFRGNNPQNWHTDIPNFGQVRYEGVYDGVAMVWHGQERGATQYDFVVQPNADAGEIELEFAGADSLETDSDGNLLVHTKAGVVKHGRPFSYQETRGQRAEVASSFVVENNRVKFSVGAHDRSKPLTIDPSVSLSNLAFSTFLGGEATDVGRAIAVDRTGSVYVTGDTTSLLFPTTAGAFDTAHTTPAVFVTKMNAIGSDLIYSTYLDGNGNDQGLGIAVDLSGNAYVAGSTLSSDFPTTAANAFDTTANGNQDVFLTKLNSTGTALSYSTFLGGGGDDSAHGIAIDSSGNAYVTGSTVSVLFPTTVGALDTTLNGTSDMIASKINASLSGAASLVYSTYIGGNSDEAGLGIAVDSSGSAYLTGLTTSTDYPTTAGVFDTTANGNFDTFVTRVNASGTALVYSTYIGGDADDLGQGIAVDAAGQAYITGRTVDGTIDYPTTAGAFDTTHNGALDVFVTKLNATATAPLAYSTFIGGSSTDIANSIAVDSGGFIYITGVTTDAATDYPTTAGAFATTHSGNNDVFVTKLKPTTTGEPLIYSTLIGGSSLEIGYGIAVDSTGNVYVAGEVDPTATTSFPTTAEAFQPISNSGSRDGFVFKLGNFAITGRVIDSASGNPSANVMVGMSGHTSNFMLTGTDGRFAFTNTGSYTPYNISASRTNTNINPNIFNIDSLDSNRDLIFLAEAGQPSAAPGVIDGVVARSDGGSLAGVTITLTGSQSRKTVTDSNGHYRFAQVETGGFYIVAPSRTDYGFTPANRAFSLQGTKADAAFTATAESLTVNPLDISEFFVRQQYVDFLGREPDEDGFDYWSADLNSCGANASCIDPRRVAVSDAFFFEPEYQRTGSYVFRLYRSAFGNNQPLPNPDLSNVTEAAKLPSYTAFMSDRGRVLGGPRLVQSQKDLASDFVQRPEFLAQYPATQGATEFIDAVLSTIRNSTGADLTSQRSALLELYNDGGRAAILYRLADDDLANSPIDNRSFVNAEYNRALVFTQYAGYLRRDADVAGLLFWLDQVNSAPLRNVSKQHALVCSFITSGEYQLRFSSLITHGNAECGH